MNDQDERAVAVRVELQEAIESEDWRSASVLALAVAATLGGTNGATLRAEAQVYATLYAADVAVGRVRVVKHVDPIPFELADDPCRFVPTPRYVEQRRVVEGHKLVKAQAER